MKLIINGEEAKIPSGSSSGGVTLGQVNSAIDTKLDAYEPQEVYSTEETRIGTWIDGKPLYRKVVLATSPSTTTDEYTIASIQSGLIIRAFFATMGPDSLGTYYNVPFAYNTTYTATIFVRENAVRMMVSNDVYCNLQCHIVLEYTKTTDQAQAVATNTVLKAPSKVPALNAIQSAAVTASTQEVLIDG